jgi:hypothetical protein
VFLPPCIISRARPTHPTRQVTLIDDMIVEHAHPLAASTDISKLIRGDYADAAHYTDMWLESVQQWRELNESCGREIFHQTGAPGMTTLASPLHSEFSIGASLLIV